MSRIVDKLTLEEIYLVRSCNLRNPDKARIKQELEGYLELEGMGKMVGDVLKKLEGVSADDIKAIWEFPLD